MSNKMDQALRNILYIEDNSVNCILMELILKKVDRCKLIAVMSAEIGLELVESLKPKLIIMDVYLPGIDGIEAAKRLKDSVMSKHIPIIIVSSDSSPETTERAINAGCQDYITKPIDIKNMILVINRYLNAGITVSENSSLTV